MAGLFCLLASLAVLQQAASSSGSGSAALAMIEAESTAQSLRERVEAGDASGMENLAELQLALGGSIAQSLELLRRAGERGRPCALLRASRLAANLGLDFVAADRDLDRALELGCTEARYEKAMILIRQGRDGARAIALLQQAIAEGDSRALLYLGRAYQSGVGIGDADARGGLAEAETLFRRAAIAGDPEGQGALVQLLLDRHRARLGNGSGGGDRNALREALYWAQILAARGGEAARIQARRLTDDARAAFGADQTAVVLNGAARFRPGTFTLPAAPWQGRPQFP